MILRHLPPVIFGAAFFVSSVASAQAIPVQTAPAPQATPRPTAPAAQPAAQPAPTEQELAARERFQSGELLFENGNFDAALAEYQAVYDLLEGHPRRYNVLFNIGLCNERLFRYDRAIEFYQRYLDEGGADAEDRATVEASIRTLHGLLGTVTIRSNVSASVWAGDREIGRAPGEVMLPAGTHALSMRADGYEEARVEVQVTPRANETVSVTLDEVFDGISPAGFGITLSLALVAAGVGGYFAWDAYQLNQDAEMRVPGDPTVELDRDAIRDRALLADVFFGVAGLFAVTAIILLPFTRFGGGDEDEPETRDSFALTPTFGPNSVGMSLRGTL